MLVVKPDLLAVSCEKIKHILLGELGEQDHWSAMSRAGAGHGKIYIALHERFGEQVVLQSIRNPDGWTYRLDMPTQIEPPKALRALVSALALELSNRNNPAESAVLPDWVIEGLTGHVQALALDNLLLQPEFKLTKVQVEVDPIRKLRQLFIAEQPLTFQELSWPEKLDEERQRFFGSSAHLLVHQLLHSQNGREGFARFLRELPLHKNWQSAFLKGFQFGALVDAEKWWALNLVQFTGINPAFAWPREEALRQFVQSLSIRVQVHSAPEALPEASFVPLQTVVQDWDLPRQEIAFQTVVNRLKNNRYRFPQELVALADEYRHLLESFLEQRTSRPFSTRTESLNTNALKKRTIAQLNRLDEKLASLRLFPTFGEREDAVRRALQSVSP